MHSAILFSGLPRTLAYLDPGSGSLIVQMLIAVVVGGGLLLRTFWGRITGKKKAEEDMDETEKKEADKQSE